MPLFVVLDHGELEIAVGGKWVACGRPDDVMPFNEPRMLDFAVLVGRIVARVRIGDWTPALGHRLASVTKWVWWRVSHEGGFSL